MSRNPNTDFENYLSNIQSDIENLVRKVNKPGSVITGFIFSDDPKSLIRFGNNGNKGKNLIKLHLALSSFAAEMEGSRAYPEVSYADIGCNESQGVSKEDVAYNLAQSVLQSGMEPEYSAKALELAEQYIKLCSERK